MFRILLKEKQLVLSDDHKIPTSEQMKGKKCYKYHNVFGHNTNTCNCIRDIIQKEIEEGRLIFEGKKKGPMRVDTDPFQVAINYSELDMRMGLEFFRGF